MVIRIHNTIPLEHLLCTVHMQFLCVRVMNRSSTIIHILFFRSVRHIMTHDLGRPPQLHIHSSIYLIQQPSFHHSLCSKSAFWMSWWWSSSALFLLCIVSKPVVLVLSTQCCPPPALWHHWPYWRLHRNINNKQQKQQAALSLRA